MRGSQETKGIQFPPNAIGAKGAVMVNLGSSDTATQAGLSSGPPSGYSRTASSVLVQESRENHSQSLHEPCLAPVAAERASLAGAVPLVSSCASEVLLEGNGDSLARQAVARARPTQPPATLPSRSWWHVFGHVPSQQNHREHAPPPPAPLCSREHLSGTSRHAQLSAPTLSAACEDRGEQLGPTRASAQAEPALLSIPQPLPSPMTPGSVLGPQVGAVVSGPRLGDYPEVLWQLWRRYIPCGAQTMDTLASPSTLAAVLANYTPRTRTGKLAALFFRDTARDTMPQSALHCSSAFTSDADAAAAWLACLVAHLSQDTRLRCHISSPHAALPHTPISPHTFATPLPRSASASLDTAGMASSRARRAPVVPAEASATWTPLLQPSHILHEAEQLSSAAVAFLQAHYPKEAAQCVNCAYHLMRAVERIRTTPVPPIHEEEEREGDMRPAEATGEARDGARLRRRCPSATTRGCASACPCGCVREGRVADEWCRDFHASYYSAHHAYDGTARVPPADAGGDGGFDVHGIGCESNNPLYMLPFVAVEMFAQLVVAVTVQCAEEAQRRQHHHLLLHPHEQSRKIDQRDAEGAANSTSTTTATVQSRVSPRCDDNALHGDSVRVARQEAAPRVVNPLPDAHQGHDPLSDLRIDRSTFHSFFTPVKQQLVMASCVLLAWKQLDINANEQFFFLDAKARSCYRRSVHRSGGKLYANDTVLKDDEEMSETASALAESVGQSCPTPRFPVNAFAAFRVRSDLTQEDLVQMERYVLTKLANSSAFGRMPLWMSVAVEVTTAHYDARKLAVVCRHELCATSVKAHDSSDANKSRNSTQSWHDGRVAIVNANYCAAMERLMCVGIQWLLVPYALLVPSCTQANVDEESAEVTAREQKKLYWRLSRHHPLLGVALAVVGGAVTPDWAAELVGPAATAAPATRESPTRLGVLTNEADLALSRTATSTPTTTHATTASASNTPCSPRDHAYDTDAYTVAQLDALVSVVGTLTQLRLDSHV